MATYEKGVLGSFCGLAGIKSSKKPGLKQLVQLVKFAFMTRDKNKNGP